MFFQKLAQRSFMIFTPHGQCNSEAQMDHAGKEGGHEQMLRQTARMLISLATCPTFEFTAVGFFAILHQVLTFASSSHTGLFECRLFIVIHFIILLVVNGALAPVRFTS